MFKLKVKKKKAEKHTYSVDTHRSIRLQTLICFAVWSARGKGIETKKPEDIITVYRKLAESKCPEEILNRQDRAKVRRYFAKHFKGA